MLNYLKNVLENMPSGWLSTTTHRLDIYDEKLAKTEFLEQFKLLYNKNIADTSALDNLPTAYDYIRLGHPLSCILEWAIAYLHDKKTENIISFSSQTIPVLAILRNNLLENKNTQIRYVGELPDCFDAEKFPAISFKSSAVKETKTKGTYTVEGDLTMHGVTKKVVFNGVHTGNSKNYKGTPVAGLQISGVVKRSEFGMGEVSPGLADEVKLVADLEVVKN